MCHETTDACRIGALEYGGVRSSVDPYASSALPLPAAARRAPLLDRAMALQAARHSCAHCSMAFMTRGLWELDPSRVVHMSTGSDRSFTQFFLHCCVKDTALPPRRWYSRIRLYL